MIITKLKHTKKKNVDVITYVVCWKKDKKSHNTRKSETDEKQRRSIPCFSSMHYFTLFLSEHLLPKLKSASSTKFCNV